MLTDILLYMCLQKLMNVPRLPIHVISMRIAQIHQDIISASVMTGSLEMGGTVKVTTPPNTTKPPSHYPLNHNPNTH